MPSSDEISGFSPPAVEARRFVFIDALRGIAALAVVSAHFITTDSVASVYQTIVPRPLYLILSHGYLGVEIFFVISGFVIAYSMRGQRITGSYLGRFAVRRSIRLDPLYWVTLLMMLVLNVLTMRYFPALGGNDRNFPGIGVVLANAFYLHKLLGAQTIAAVSWTLCLEIQFYLIFAVLIGMSQRLSSAAPRRFIGFPSVATALLMIPLFLVSLGGLLTTQGFDPSIFLSFWHMFFLGVVTWWVIEGSVKPAWFWIAVCLELLAGFFNATELSVAASVTALSIYAASRAKGLETWSGGSALQFFGRISYSLYLSQGIFGQKTIKLGTHFTGASKAASIMWLLCGYAVTIVTAYALYRLVERPTVRLSSRLKKRPVAPLGRGEKIDATVSAIAAPTQG